MQKYIDSKPPDNFWSQRIKLQEILSLALGTGTRAIIYLSIWTTYLIYHSPSWIDPGTLKLHSFLISFPVRCHLFRLTSDSLKRVISNIRDNGKEWQWRRYLYSTRFLIHLTSVSNNGKGGDDTKCEMKVSGTPGCSSLQVLITPI